MLTVFSRSLVSRGTPRALGAIAALGAQTGALTDAQGNPVPMIKHVLTSAGVGAISGAAAGVAVGLVLGGGLIAGLAVGAISGAAGNAAIALLGLD